MDFDPVPLFPSASPRRLPGNVRRAAPAARLPFFQLVANMLIAAAFSGLPLQERGVYLSRQPSARTTWPLVKRLGTPPRKRKIKNPLN